MLVEGFKIGWLDSARMPSRIHRTTSEDGTTACGHKTATETNWTLRQVPAQSLGHSRFCRICFEHGGKSLPWTPACS